MQSGLFFVSPIMSPEGQGATAIAEPARLIVSGSGNGGCRRSTEPMAEPVFSARPPTHGRRIGVAGELFGQPKGLAFLFTTEMWERFSYYGMRALLVLYMTKYLLISDRASTVRGLAGIKNALEGLFGPLGAQPLSSHIYGFYTALVYLTPIFGGLLADRVLGQRRTVVIGATLMAIGHFMMAVEQLFLLHCWCSFSAMARSSPISRPRSAAFTRRAITAATAPIPSSKSASISARSWRRWSAARSARRRGGTTGSLPQASAC